jgi:hypothetical protein
MLEELPMHKRSSLEEWLEIIHGAVVMMLLAALFPLFALYELTASGQLPRSREH